MRLLRVLASDITDVWPDINATVTSACEYNGNRYSADDCLNELLKAEKQLWLVVDAEHQICAVVITCIVPFPRIRACMIDICTGQGIERWARLLDIIEDWAKANNCQQMFVCGRNGMVKVLRPRGYSWTHCLLEKDL